ncbi:heptaprenyl diphosphate synthase subunit II [Lactococcus hodotermopsidis]|uniref:Heptaprenyl diphosphate synthase subunit II n=1 Tax=Pseudolactococcus hodotermopsidis TaxID=2709157 RepID=A0A6A0BCS2_9LACT|nr:polyprenyl synthetase family protein [Lactococcus hodotermopsidis]GFH43200.1 heptaprenyl diphosphate synthase subunit II [Lactococcus hodotermopsidis]
MIYWKNYPQLSLQLETVQKTLLATIKVKNPQTQAAILSLLSSGGKLLRPAYLLLFAELTSLDADKRIALASSIELLHTATLIHDDVIDKAETRRGVPTISHLYGNDVAVYAGDYLFVVIFKLMIKHALDLSNLSNRVDAMEKLLDGELGQMNLRFNTEQTISDYLNNISGKTAELFAQACAVAPFADGQDKLAKLSYDIGQNIGIAFQIMDDYLDYTADTTTFGKPVLADIRQGIYSAPVLFALSADENVADLLKKEDFEGVFARIKATHALEKTQHLARKYTRKALKLIEKLPENPVKSDIRQITENLLERKL